MGGVRLTCAIQLGALLAAVALAGVGPESPLKWSAEEIRRILEHSPLPPPPADDTHRVADDPRAARLGQALFFDPRLSGNGKLSCASCHVPHHGFTDGHPLAEGMGVGSRNTPSLWNVAYQRSFFWDGRADSLESQALQPIEGTLELGGSRLAVARLLAGDAALRAAYEAVFGSLPHLDGPEPGGPFGPAPEEVDRVFLQVGQAIAAYERRLISSRSPFDRFARALREGDEAGQSVLSPAAQRGVKLFVGKGECQLCHRGPNFTDGDFHHTGVPSRAGLPPDPGRGGRGQLKTPTLRNVALTAPYMHQGQLETLRQVLLHYSTLDGAGSTQQPLDPRLAPRGFSEGEIADLIAFLGSLTDEEIDPELLVKPAKPELPALPPQP